MKWGFTPEQVTSGEIEYTLKQFREDLHREVADNFPEYDEKDLETMFHLAYDVCYITAAKRDFKELLLHCTLRGIKVTKEFLELLRDANKDN
ncbi:MAG: hypothetical protein GY850_39760, partial [bacterium]|nr:hypothetical protein [bacterium]